MSSKVPIPSSGYYLTPEECQEMFRGFTPGHWEADIPDHHKEILEERIADYCKNGVHMTPWEEFEKELFDM
ncbi:MAG TPA: addiction module protein [Pyrinomonadaceae bacterium]|nr:addiction module protein [Pyrinomonadaceae bacterium]